MDEPDYERLVDVEPVNGADGMLNRVRQFIHEIIFCPSGNSYTKLILLRLPSIMLADFILLNSELITAHFFTSHHPSQSIDNSTVANALIIYFMSRFVLALLLATCLLLFVLSLNYVLNVYKCIGLVALPFLFTLLMEIVSIRVPDPHGFVNFHGLHIPRFALVCAIYALIVSLTIALYQDIYAQIIFDKFNVHAHYMASRADGHTALANYLESLANVQFESMFQENGDINNQNETSDRINDISIGHVYADSRFRWFHVNKRRFFILFYSFLSIVVNELPLLFTVVSGRQPSADDEEDKRPFNIMSLGYLLLLTYDLGVNMDQMLLRLLVKVKIVTRLVSQYGLHNFVSFTWFERLRVPFLLRVYFLVRTYLFTLNFLFYYPFYARFDAKLGEQNATDTYSLYATFADLFAVSDTNSTVIIDSSSSPNSAEEYAIASSLLHGLSLLPVSLTEVYSTSGGDARLQSQQHYDVVFTASRENALVYVKMIVLNLTSNMMGIACLTSVLSYQFHMLGKVMQWLLNSKIVPPRRPQAARNNRGARQGANGAQVFN
jgi:hypothetical protein